MSFIRKERKAFVLKEEKEGELIYLTFPAFSQTGLVKHLFSTKRGGVSQGIFESMNLTYTRGDKKEAVEENFARIAKLLGRKTSDYRFSKQTHTTNVKVIRAEESSLDYEDVDGLVTNVPTIVLVTVFADCVPLFFLDPVKKVIGLSHSGWKGSLNNIAKETIRIMKEEYDCNCSDILVAIGPSICKDCYEVEEEVASAFDKKCFSKKENGKYLLDLWKANEINLIKEGIVAENISITDICTCCNHEELFSHRATQGKRGNLGAFLSLNAY